MTHEEFYNQETMLEARDILFPEGFSEEIPYPKGWAPQALVHIRNLGLQIAARDQAEVLNSTLFRIHDHLSTISKTLDGANLFTKPQ